MNKSIERAIDQRERNCFFFSAEYHSDNSDHEYINRLADEYDYDNATTDLDLHSECSLTKATNSKWHDDQ